MKENKINKISIIGAGRLGFSIAKGLIKSKQYQPSDIILNRRNVELLKESNSFGFQIEANQQSAIEKSDLIILSIGPKDLKSFFKDNSIEINSSQVLASTIAGVSIHDIEKEYLIANKSIEFSIFRVMPNIAVELCESMTCLSMKNSSDNNDYQRDLMNRKNVLNIFSKLGMVKVIEEELIGAATALCGSGLAFFLRSIRAAAHGGTEIGFHADEALALAAQTAKGAASLVNDSNDHPELQIDKVTTPKGITISGLNEMDHSGFSSAMIHAIVKSAEKLNKIK
ncbi:MAG: pyrroline-5-carboxylate reductase [Candidatus Marinimicrobia bacterium]|nr:pyrroline-5-carboxylate reductase [Candidatus Neomarinimicrobiota bacterium]